MASGAPQSLAANLENKLVRRFGFKREKVPDWAVGHVSLERPTTDRHGVNGVMGVFIVVKEDSLIVGVSVGGDLESYPDAIEVIEFIENELEEVENAEVHSETYKNPLPHK